MGEMRPEAAEPAGEAPVRIVLVDDHAILRQGLRSLLEREHGLQVVGEASSPGEALAVVERTRPTIVLLDMKLSPASDNGGLVLCAQLTKRHPGLRSPSAASAAIPAAPTRARRRGWSRRDGGCRFANVAVTGI